MTKNYKIAGKTAAISSLYPNIHDYCADYRTDEVPDFTVEMTLADIVYEEVKTNREYALEKQSAPGFSPEILELTAVYRKIAERLIKYDRIVFHGACVAVDGKGYLFTAKSGMGKSTHAALWGKLLGNRAVNINDDKPILHISDSGVIVYGTPWTGKHHRGCNLSVPLRAICLLERSEKNQIVPITKIQAYPLLLQQSYRSRDVENLQRTLTLVDRLARSVQLFRLGCNTDLSAAETAWNAMKG